MNILKTFTLKWWQTGTFKLGMLALGIAIGADWQDLFGGYVIVLLVVTVVSLTYVSSVSRRDRSALRRCGLLALTLTGREEI
jgi:hypothetical protein